MGRAAEQWRAMQEYHARQDFIAGYEEAQSRLRMSVLCRDTAKPLAYPLWPRIVELAAISHTGDRPTGRGQTPQEWPTTASPRTG